MSNGLFGYRSVLSYGPTYCHKMWLCKLIIIFLLTLVAVIAAFDLFTIVSMRRLLWGLGFYIIFCVVWFIDIL